jgi:hypothetical protein
MIHVERGVMTGIWESDESLEAAAHHIVAVMDTRDAILKYVDPMAKVLLAAGQASAHAMGDPAGSAIDKWAKVIADRAKEMLRDHKDMRLSRMSTPAKCSPGNMPKGQ